MWIHALSTILLSLSPSMYLTLLRINTCGNTSPTNIWVPDHPLTERQPLTRQRTSPQHANKQYKPGQCHAAGRSVPAPCPLLGLGPARSKAAPRAHHHDMPHRPDRHQLAHATPTAFSTLTPRPPPSPVTSTARSHQHSASARANHTQPRPHRHQLADATPSTSRTAISSLTATSPANSSLTKIGNIELSCCD